MSKQAKFSPNEYADLMMPSDDMDDYLEKCRTNPNQRFSL